jgi:hypothetical protein
MNDKLKIIAEYDGWVKMEESNLYRRNTHRYLDEMEYLTSLDWLHPVAMKVLGELRELRSSAFNDIDNSGVRTVKECYDTITPYIDMIKQSCTQPPINGEYSDLFNATVEGIIYLQNQSK